jgi:hypothetical protein
MRRIKYSAKRNQIKVEKSKFGKSNLENDVIYDALKVICNRNLKKIRRYLALEVFELKIVKLRRIFRRFRLYWADDIERPVYYKINPYVCVLKPPNAR